MARSLPWANVGAAASGDGIQAIRRGEYLARCRRRARGTLVPPTRQFCALRPSSLSFYGER
jgi:hypothetical protein